MTSLEAYGRWNNGIANYFFNSERARLPVYLSVDETVLRRVAATWNLPKDPVEDFLDSLNGLMDPRRFFQGMYSYAQQFEKKPTSKPPLFIAGLALSVLAASQMGTRTDRTVAQHNYYAHLNRLLRVNSSGSPVYFDRIAKLWEVLHLWLEHVHKGQLGTPTARQVGHFPYIGWPISQALIRRADTEELKCLADLAGVSSELEPTPEDLLPALRIWLQEEGALSRLASLLGPQPNGDILAHVADQLAAVLPELDLQHFETGRTHQQLAFMHLRMAGFTHAKMAVQLAWRCPKDLEEDPEAILPDGSLAEVSDHGDWLVVSSDPDWILNGVTLEFRGHPVKGRLTPPLLFKSGDGFGRPGWFVQTFEVSIGDPHWLICPEAQLPEATASIASCGRMGKVFVDLAWLPRNWVLVVDVYFDHSPDGLFAKYHPRTFVPWGWKNGVRIRRNTWLRGCLPHLDAPESIKFEIFSASGELLHTVHGGADLNSLRLSEGGYLIRGDRVRSSRLIVSTPPWPLPEPRNPQVVDLPPSSNRPATRIQGALVEADGPLEEFIFLPAGDFAILGSRIGEIDYTYSNSTFGVIEWHRLFTPVWRIRLKGGKVAEVLPLQKPPQPPAPVLGGDPTQQKVWAEIIVSARRKIGRLNQKDQATFRKYAAIASSLLGGRR